jgi:hypothetical protein
VYLNGVGRSEHRWMGDTNVEIGIKFLELPEPLCRIVTYFRFQITRYSLDTPVLFGEVFM